MGHRDTGPGLHLEALRGELNAHPNALSFIIEEKKEKKMFHLQGFQREETSLIKLLTSFKYCCSYVENQKKFKRNVAEYLANVR